ncbi:hypothetical protein CDAR_98551 [Caerostris darwini]|uniref:Uncharacterized protein n=1 Tax=Caerostris darwini TaxID=1538125 RepID=A0AAV4UFW8_9ARAC|nr:hypothetical protein CDAR_98551 [Caerostris darwini]
MSHYPIKLLGDHHKELFQNTQPNTKPAHGQHDSKTAIQSIDNFISGEVSFFNVSKQTAKQTPLATALGEFELFGKGRAVEKGGVSSRPCHHCGPDSCCR